MLLCFNTFGITYPSSIKVSDRPEYDKYYNYCTKKVPYGVQQEGRTTYDHVTILPDGKPRYFLNPQDTVWFEYDAMDYWENSLITTVKPSVQFVDSYLNGTFNIETPGSYRFKNLVMEVQKCLLALGYTDIIIDGNYGATTAKNISSFIAKEMYYSIPTTVNNYKILTVEMLITLKDKASLAGLNVSSFSIGKKSVRITRTKVLSISQRRMTVSDFVNNWLTGKIQANVLSRN